MQIHDALKKTTKKKKRVGRGGKRGYTSGRGSKGQKARAGRKIRPAIRDLIKRLPKKRGVKLSASRTPLFRVTLKELNENFKDGEKVTPRTLDRKKIIKLPAGNKNNVKVKVLDRGEINKKLILENINASKSAAGKIFNAGGEIRNVK